MAKYEQRKKIPAPADVVVGILSSPEHLEDEAKIEGAISAKARVEKEEGDVVFFIVDREDPARGPAPNKTEKIEVSMKWDRAARSCKWRCRVLRQEKMSKIQGTTEVVPDGDDACIISEHGTVEIKLPLIGNLIAKAVISGIKKDFEPKCKLVKKKAEALA